MAPTRESRRTVFRQIAQQSYADWPLYESTPLFNRTSLSALESDVRVVSETWFNQDQHEAAESIVWALPLAYIEFNVHDRYTGSTNYGMETLVRLFLLKELYGWDHETALVTYLLQNPDLCERFGLRTIPDQSTLWRSWHHRFTTPLCETIETAARTILIKAQDAGVTVPREPQESICRRGDDGEQPVPDDQTVLEQAETVTDHLTRVAFPSSVLHKTG